MDDDESLSSAGEVSAMAVSDPYYRKFAALRRRCQSVQQVGPSVQVVGTDGENRLRILRGENVQ